MGVSSLTQGDEEESQMTLEDLAKAREQAALRADPEMDRLLDMINGKFGSGTIRRGGR